LYCFEVPALQEDIKISFVLPVKVYWFRLSLISGKPVVSDLHVVGVTLEDFVATEGVFWLP
jgi:hypothetical protein